MSNPEQNPDQPQNEDNSYRIRKVVLPSGKIMEVVYFEHPEDEVAPPKPQPSEKESRIIDEITGTDLEMEDYVDRFLEALEHDHIEPMDF
jgi:hypothetical protein